MKEIRKGLYRVDSFHRLSVVPKPALGRDLGKLMGRAPNESGEIPGTAKPAPLGAGVRSLMQSQPLAAPKQTTHRVPRWYLFAGDTLLIALALVIIYKSPSPLSLPREIFCIAIVVLAASLAIFALLTPESEAQPELRAGASVMPDGEPPKKLGSDKADARGA
jgi:hypothetical protein